MAVREKREDNSSIKYPFRSRVIGLLTLACLCFVLLTCSSSTPLPKEEDLPAEHNLAFPASELVEKSKWYDPPGRGRSIHGEPTGSDAGVVDLKYNLNDLDSTKLASWYQEELEALGWSVDRREEIEPGLYPNHILLDAERETESWKYTMHVRQQSPDTYETRWLVIDREAAEKARNETSRYRDNTNTTAVTIVAG